MPDTGLLRVISHFQPNQIVGALYNELLWLQPALHLRQSMRKSKIFIAYFLEYQTMAVTLTEKGQITIPLRIRKRLGLKPGMRLVFDEEAPFLKATREVNLEQMRTALGCLAHEGTLQARHSNSAEMIDSVRGGVEE